MQSLAALLRALNLPDGFSETGLPGVRFFASRQAIARAPLVYDPGICIVAQGTKVGYLGGRQFVYDADTYLLVSATLPFECETFASPEAPLLGLYIDIDLPQLNALIDELGTAALSSDEVEQAMPRVIAPVPLEAEMLDALGRLIRCLGNASERRILGPGLLREIFYRALQGSQAAALYALASHNGHFARVARALQLIQHNYAQHLDVEKLARQANMSSSAFHRAFKQVTDDSPLQYLKKIRLSKARDFIVQQGMKAYVAADQVGYESASQFSREFKRYFGHSPAQLMRDSQQERV